jgi:hypothetical protein
MFSAFAAALATGIAACATTAKRPGREADVGALVADMPLFPLTEAAVRAWVATRASPRDFSLNLGSDRPYVETLLDESSPVPRVGFFFRKDPWRVAAVLYWLPKSDPPPPTQETVGRLWGMPLLRSGKAERYTPDAHLVVRLLDESYPLPEEPEVALPGDVLIKGPTRTFHRELLFALVNGRIWFKRNPALEGTVGEPWRLFGDGLPAPTNPFASFDRPARIEALSADGDDLLAVDDRGRAYVCRTRSRESWISTDGWADGWGFPGKRPLALQGRAAGYRSFAIGRRAQHARWFEDAIGNRIHFGPMGTSTIYLLRDNGSELLFTDDGLPNDFSRQLCGPDRGRFVADRLSASASAIFLIDRYGRMMTKFEDYDLNGGTPNFEYTYRSEVRADEDGDSLLHSLSPYYLPLAPWRWHEPPRLEGAARLSRDITVVQEGVGNAARELRVAGLGADGAKGYYRKLIEDEAWEFVPNPYVEIDPANLLDPDDLAAGRRDFSESGARPEMGTLPRGRSYRATWNGRLEIPREGGADPVEGVEVQVDWDPYCPPARVTFTVERGISFDVTLQTVDMWSPATRVRPGFDGTPLMLLGTMVIGDDVLADPRPQVRRIVRLLRRYHHANFAFVVALGFDRADVRALDEGPGLKGPIALVLRRTGEWDPPDAPRPPAGVLAATEGLRGGDLASLASAPGLVVDPENAPVATLRDALGENQRLRDDLRALRRTYEEQVRGLDAFRESIKLIAPFAPAMRLGRLPLLPKLLSMLSLRGKMISVDAETNWPGIDETLSTRVKVYEDALARRGVAAAR